MKRNSGLSCDQQNLIFGSIKAFKQVYHIFRLFIYTLVWALLSNRVKGTVQVVTTFFEKRPCGGQARERLRTWSFEEVCRTQTNTLLKKLEHLLLLIQKLRRKPWELLRALVVLISLGHTGEYGGESWQKQTSLQ